MALTKVTSGLISASASSVDLNIDAGTLYIDSTNNRVGIGTISPNTLLHVNAADDTTIRIQSTGTDSLSRLYLQNDARTYAVQIEGASSDAFQIYDTTAGAARLTIDASGNATFSGTISSGAITSSGNISSSNGLLQFDEGNIKTRQYEISTGTGGGDFELGKIESNSSTDGAVEGVIRFAYDYGSTVDNPAIHFNFAQRGGTARGTWWYEHDDQAATADRIYLQLIDDGAGNMHLWVRVADYNRCFIETIWRQCSTVTNSGSLSSSTITSGTTLFDTSNDPTSEFHIGKLFAHDNITTSGSIGIGISAPYAALNTQVTSNFSTTYNDYSGDGLHITCDATSGSGNYGGGISFSRISSGSSHRKAGIALVQTNTDADECGLAFFTAPSPTSGVALSEKMRLDDEGKLGIGTSSPDSLLHISSGNSGDAIVIIEADEDNNAEGDLPLLLFRADGGINEGSIGLYDNELRLINNVSGAGGMSFWTGTTDNTSLENSTGATERVTISSGGNVGINETSPVTPLHVTAQYTPIAQKNSTHGVAFSVLPWSAGQAYLNAGTYYNGNWQHVSDNAYSCLFIMSGLSGIYWYSSSNSSASWNQAAGVQLFNNVGQLTASSASDKRLKQNIQNLNSQDALNKVSQLQGVTYEWNDTIKQKKGGEYTDGTFTGFIAQDVEKIYPEACLVSFTDEYKEDDITGAGSSDDTYYGEVKGVRAEKMVPLLVEAIKELKSELDDAKARIQTLEGN